MCQAEPVLGMRHIVQEHAHSSRQHADMVTVQEPNRSRPQLLALDILRWLKRPEPLLCSADGMTWQSATHTLVLQEQVESSDQQIAIEPEAQFLMCQSLLMADPPCRHVCKIAVRTSPRTECSISFQTSRTVIFLANTKRVLNSENWGRAVDSAAAPDGPRNFPYFSCSMNQSQQMGKSANTSIVRSSTAGLSNGSPAEILSSRHNRRGDVQP